MATNQKQAKGMSAARPRSYSDLYKNSKNSATVASKVEERANDSKPSGTQQATVVDWRGEYGYVLDDLRRLALVTGILVVAMVAISFVI